jgi:hypothetical protein
MLVSGDLWCFSPPPLAGGFALSCDRAGQSRVRAVRDSGCDAARTGLTLENKGISVLRPSMDGLTLVVALSLSF